MHAQSHSSKLVSRPADVGARLNSNATSLAAVQCDYDDTTFD